MNILRKIRDAYRRCLQRLVRPNPAWVEAELISPHNIIYRVRNATGYETQILGNDRIWRPVSRARWSCMPCHEQYHKDQFLQAKPYVPNGGSEPRET